jgi:hypothetical protein
MVGCGTYEQIFCTRMLRIGQYGGFEAGPPGLASSAISTRATRLTTASHIISAMFGCKYSYDFNVIIDNQQWICNEQPSKTSYLLHTHLCNHQRITLG